MQKKLDILENKLYDDIVLGWVLSEADYSEVSIPVQVVYEKSAPREASGSGEGWTGKRKSQSLISDNTLASAQLWVVFGT